MNELALQLIHENRRAYLNGEESSKKIDLGTLGLSEIPGELFENTWLEVIVLGVNSSNNHLSKNKIAKLPDQFCQFKNLKALDFSENKIHNIEVLAKLDQLTMLALGGTQITDFSPLAKLDQLTMLALGGTQITDFSPLAKLDQLTMLDLSYTQITDLGPLEKLDQLTKLDLSGTQITDLSPLEKLDQLTQLILNYTQITDFSPLAKLDQLTQLRLINTQITDLGPLEKLDQLTKLWLNNTQITDFSPLAKLDQLTELILWSTKITDLSPLAKLGQLTKLDLSGTQITDLSPLAKLDQLTQLDLSDTRITDLSPLAKLDQLTELILWSTQITDFSPLAKLDQLTQLRLINTQITDLSPLAKLDQLTQLDLSDTQITDFSPLAKLGQLTKLDLSGTKITDLSPLAKLDQLTELDLSGTKITDLSPLAKLDQLTQLILNYTQITDLSPLAKLDQLTDLDLGDTQITDFSPLAKLDQLTQLRLINTQITDLSPLAKLDQLTQLDLSDTQITDLSPLAKLDQLTELILSGTKITDLSPLAKLDQLTELDLSGTQITDLSPLAKLDQLTQLILNYTQITDLSPPEKLINLRSLRLTALEQHNIRFPLSIARLPNLKSLVLYQSDFQNLPTALTDQISNCLQDLRNYVACLQNEDFPPPYRQAKIILLGNGRVGKTSLVKALCDQEFDIEERSTDQITVRDWKLYGVKPELLQDRPLNVKIWDFGGQDIYMTTHRLFLRTTAVFLLVWDSETENSKDHEDGHGLTFENYRLEHWVDYLKTVSKGPVIVVQNKVDVPVQRYAGYEELLKKQYASIRHPHQYVSAKQDHKTGLPKLRNEIVAACNTLPDIGKPFPKSWQEVKDHLQQITDPKIDKIRYLEICKDFGLNESMAETLLTFLHNSGDLYYLQNTEPEQIILDQQWAIDAVYAIFNRKNKCYQRLQQSRSQYFTRKDLADYVWNEKGYSKEEQNKFIQFMISTKTCFEYSNGTYVAPQLLSPDRPQKLSQRAEWKNPNGPALSFRFNFLHQGIIETFIVRAGRMVNQDDPILWRRGICIYDQQSECDALIEAIPQNKEIRVLTHGHSGTIDFLVRIASEFKNLADYKDYALQLFYSNNGGRDFCFLEDIVKSNKTEAKYVLAETKTNVKLESLLPFARRLSESNENYGLQGAGLKREPMKPEIRCFISYAHAYKDEADIFVNDLRAATKNLKLCHLEIWTDDSIELGSDWDQSIQDEISKCDLAILLISLPFMASQYIEEDEVEKLITRKEAEGVTIIPIYFAPCNFEVWSFLEKHQLFKPKGSDIGRPEFDKCGFCYCDLIEFEHGQAKSTTSRDRYMLSFVEKIEPLLKKIIQ